ncbi:cell wall hydrolase SleB [Natranaerobius thermophilus JW/NM-WN-LF]|uniref:Cell wall hydrolase SleB n=1 Tax=Natranaerobius thermophilus (strain ATCC BAA-1301 / DSM 18059 / JW/NM-WN-LF) TaxID=457570 RepID=B2A669_NATTJ|nr:cell wall hydrolase SleB [Natranaerobius thermophilus JW/NM-WN-LF]
MLTKGGIRLLRVSKVLVVCLLVSGLLFTSLGGGQVQAASETHTVSSGETLWRISQWYDVSLEDLRSVNNIWHNYIYPGQTLTIPSGQETETKESSNEIQETETEGSNSESQDTESESSWRRLDISSYERDLIARIVYSEARGEPYEGQVAVASVVINRVLDNRWPNNVEGVIFEPLAFTPVHNGQFWLTPNQTAYDAVEDALKGWDPSDGATFFYNPITATSSWIFTRTTIKQIGSHVFAY